jgi:propanediol utilization protein
MMTHSQLVEFLKQWVGLCSHFTDDRLDQLVQESHVVSYEPHEAVVEFGEDADFLGVLLEGDLAVSVATDGDQRQVLSRFQAGDTFREMALMSGDKTMADFIAETRCQVLRIPVAVFQSAIMTDPRAVQHISRTETQRTAPFPVEVSAHHIHLSQEHVETLFGQGHQLTRHSDHSQPGQFACQEQLTIVGPKGRIERVRVLGPARKATQVEIAMTEQFKLGIHPPIRESGDIRDTPGCTLEGPAGNVMLDRGVICALRHVHMTPADALRYGVRDKSLVRVRVAGDRELDFGDVLVRVAPNFALAMHIDTDEANAANVQTGAQGYLAGIQSET